MRNSLSSVLITLLTVMLAACGSKPEVDEILYNAKVYTVDEQFAIHEAIAIKDGKIIACGTSKGIRDSFDAKKLTNLDGKYVYPGFIDAHAHFLGYGRTRYEVDLYGCTSWDEAVKRVVRFANDNPDVYWVRGRGWDQNKFEGSAYPTNDSLNKYFPNRPVLLQRVDGHAAIANNAALELAKVTNNTSIIGGKIEVNDEKPTGLLIDNAVELVTKVIPAAKRTDYEKWLKRAQKDCFEYGITTVADCGLPFSDIQIIDTLQQEGKLDIRIYAMLSDDGASLGQFLDFRNAILNNKTTKAQTYFGENGPYKTERLYVKGVKAYVDGALGSRGACLKQPYNDKPGWSGFLLRPAEHFDSLAAQLINTDFQLCTHAIGDSGNAVVLRTYAKYLAPNNTKRWRVEHAQVVDLIDVPMFGKYSIVPSVQPTHATSDMYWAVERLGAHRMEGAYAYKTLLAQNGLLPLGTDFPVEGISPFKTYYAAVYRKDDKGYPEKGFQASEALTPEQALRGMTIWAAKGCYMEKEVGSLEPGKKADIVVLDKDLLKEPMGCGVSAVYVSGKKVK